MGYFPSQPENPKEQAKAVTLRNRKQLPEIKCKGKELRVEPKQIQDTVEKSKENMVNQTSEQKKDAMFTFSQNDE